MRSRPYGQLVVSGSGNSETARVVPFALHPHAQVGRITLLYAPVIESLGQLWTRYAISSVSYVLT